MAAAPLLLLYKSEFHILYSFLFLFPSKEQPENEQENNLMELSTGSGSTEDLGDTEVGHQVCLMLIGSHITDFVWNAFTKMLLRLLGLSRSVIVGISLCRLKQQTVTLTVVIWIVKFHSFSRMETHLGLLLCVSKYLLSVWCLSSALVVVFCIVGGCVSGLNRRSGQWVVQWPRGHRIWLAC